MFFTLLEFTLSEALSFPQDFKSTAVWSLEERFTHVRFAPGG
jgi:hypothetical protein